MVSDKLIHIYTCICIHKYMYKYMYVYIYKCIYICINVHTYIGDEVNMPETNGQ